MKRLLLIIVTVGMAACQPAYINGVPNENSPYLSVSPDSKFVLRKAVTVPARDDSIFFQYGRAMPWSTVNIYNPNCWLKLQTKRDAAQTIEPDTFVATRVRTEPRFRLGYAPGTQLASVDNDNSDNTYEVLATVITLRSARQPDVSEMVCVDWQLPQGLHPITVRKMRAALSDWFDVMLAPSTP